MIVAIFGAIRRAVLQCRRSKRAVVGSGDRPIKLLFRGLLPELAVLRVQVAPRLVF